MLSALYSVCTSNPITKELRPHIIATLYFSLEVTASTWKQQSMVHRTPANKIWREHGDLLHEVCEGFCRTHCGIVDGTIHDVILHDTTLLEEAQPKVSFHTFRLAQLEAGNWLRTSWGRGGGLFLKH